MQSNEEQVILEKIQQFTKVSNQRILEIGCGTGRLTEPLSNKTQTLVALDPDLASIAQAQKNAPLARCNVGAGETLAFADESFDIVLYSLSLHHQQAQTTLQAARRVLAKEGHVIIIEPTIEGKLEQLCHIFRDETTWLQAAQDAISNCDFIVEHREIFYAHWVFKNRQELYDGLFAYYHQPFDEAKAGQMALILGDDDPSQQVTIESELLLVLLRKDGDNQ
jgi:ubiquinone/menaquinone biosynthesis C-methylase UbiE